MTGVDSSIVVVSVVAELRDVLSPLPVGDSERPEPDLGLTPTERAQRGALVVALGASTDQGRTPGFADVPDQMRAVRLVLTGIGYQADHCQLITQQARDALTTVPLSVPGHRVERVLFASDLPVQKIASYDWQAATLVDLVVQTV